MANEITFNVVGQLANGNLTDEFRFSGSITQAAVAANSPVLSIGTSEEAIAALDVATLGYVMLKNLDATNYIDIGPDSAGTMVPLIRLKAGEFCVFRLKPGITWKAQANTAACLMKMHHWGA